LIATLVLDDGAGPQHLEFTLNAGQRYRAIVHRPKLKEQLLRKVGELAPAAVVAGRGGLVGNLKVWENLVLPAAYAGPVGFDELERRAEELFREFGILHWRFAELCALLPDRLSLFERRLVAFVRAMLAEPEIMVYDELFEGLARPEAKQAARFDRVFQRHFPFRTALYVDAEESAPHGAAAAATFLL